MRLVDADKLKEDMVSGCRRIGGAMGVVLPTLAFVDIIDKAPTEEFTFEEAFKRTVCENCEVVKANQLFKREAVIVGEITKESMLESLRPHGKWIEKVETKQVGNGWLTSHKIVCSVCDGSGEDDEGIPQNWKYCPNCGAKMDGGDEK